MRPARPRGGNARDRWDPARANLLRNAAEACGGKGHVEIRAMAEGDTVTAELADDGPGVPPTLREEIFKPFRSSKDYGTGIGLAFCRKVIESHGGTIDLVSRPGSGACFRVVLPQALVVGGPPPTGESP